MIDQASDDTIGRWLELSCLLRRMMLEKDASIEDATLLQLHGLGCISCKKSMTMSDFAEALKISSSTATSFIDKLVSLGWVERAADPDNRKFIRLQLTSEGERLVLSGKKKKEEVLSEALTLLSQHDQHEFDRILTLLLTALRTRLPSPSSL